MVLVVALGVAGCSKGGDDGGWSQGCVELQGATLADPAELLAVLRRLDDDPSMNVAAKASDAAPAVLAGVEHHAPSDIWERVEQVRMACAIAARHGGDKS